MPSPSIGDFVPLDRRVIHLWRAGRAVSMVITLGVLAVVGLVVSLSVEGSFVFVAAGWLLLAVYRLYMLVWYPPRAYDAWGYRLDGKVLETRSGIWFRVIQLLPLSRLQHVDLHRGPLERWFGLASLALHTAGTVQSAIVIPGLDAAEAARLRDQLAAIGGDDAV
jgi:membrane protein YdbS with pleckstrin-like domain